MATTVYEREISAGVMPYQLSHEATQLGTGQFVGFKCSREIYTARPQS